MKWNGKEGYIEYKAALDGVMTRLGLGATDHLVRPELAPYLTKIMSYLNRRLILLGSDDILDKLQEIFDIFDYGADLIIADEALELAKVVGVYVEEDEKEGENESESDDKEDPIETSESENPDEVFEGDVLDEDDPSEDDNEPGNEDGDDDLIENPMEQGCRFIPYDQDRFIFTWTNVLSCLLTRLKLQYSGLLTEDVIQGCGCCCGKGETWKDWESYSSGVWPEDEEYGNYDMGTTTTSWRATSGIPQCGCSYRTSSN